MKITLWNQAWMIACAYASISVDAVFDDDDDDEDEEEEE